MKKIYLLLFLLTGCIGSLQTSNQITKDENKSENNLVKNDKCMDIWKVRVVQVFDDGSALASKCDGDYYTCIGTTVLLTPQKNIDYYDDMILSVPENKCFIQNGVYKYETKTGINKTVPVLSYGYLYDATSKEEFLARLKEYGEYMNYICKHDFKLAKKNSEKNLKKCDCISDNFVDLSISVGQELGDNQTNFGNVLKDRIEKKCGDLSEIKW